MFEVTDARLYHSYMMLVAVIHRELVVNRASRLDDCGDTRFAGSFDTVGGGEKCI